MKIQHNRLGMCKSGCAHCDAARRSASANSAKSGAHRPLTISTDYARSPEGYTREVESIFDWEG